MTKEFEAVYLRIDNIRNEYGDMDYHGLDISTYGSVIPGSPLYNAGDVKVCYMIYNITDFAIPNDPNITIVTKEEYDAFKAEIEASRPLQSDTERITQLETMLQTLILEKEGMM